VVTFNENISCTVESLALLSVGEENKERKRWKAGTGKANPRELVVDEALGW
jgi:hypothetical protein